MPLQSTHSCFIARPKEKLENDYSNPLSDFARPFNFFAATVVCHFNAKIRLRAMPANDSLSRNLRRAR